MKGINSLFLRALRINHIDTQENTNLEQATLPEYFELRDFVIKKDREVT